MMQIRRSSERGHFNHGWLDTYHTFSFADYHDPRFKGFRALRVINEDRVAPGQGFGMHGHRDMEIVTCVLEGALEHKDSMGNGEVLRPGEFQRMTAGTGIEHSEFNPSKTAPVHLYQIWIFPRQKGLMPSYEQRKFPLDETPGQLRLVASPDGRQGSLTIQQDAFLYLSKIHPGQTVRHDFAAGRAGWLQVLRGSVTVRGETLVAGDGVALLEEPSLEFAAKETAEILLFDLP